MENLSDNELMLLAQEGSEDAFSVIVNRHKGALTGFIFRMVGNYEDAVDLAQESFVRVFVAIERYKSDYAFSTYLYRIASNLAISELRKRKRRRLVSLTWLTGNEEGDEEFDLQIPVGVPGPDEEVFDEEKRQVIERAILSLPPRYRAAIILRDVQDLSYEEVADVLGVGLGTIKSRISRARGLLREKLERYIVNEG